MPQRKPKITITNYGRYSKWDKRSRKLPKLLKYTTQIDAIEGNEFGLIVNVDNLKGKTLDFRIKHPPMLDNAGNLIPFFSGKLYVKTNHTQFFVGDGIGLPVHDKIGEWEVLILFENKVIVSKKFNIVEPSPET